MTEPHLLRFVWDHGTDFPTVEITCPHDPKDHERPCAMFDDPRNMTLLDGSDGYDPCGVRRWLDTAGVDWIVVLDSIESPPIPIDVDWENDYPTITPHQEDNS
jgi:hypothetical protein